MSKIIKIEGTAVYIGNAQGEMVRVPISSLNYMDPKIDDEVEIFSNEEETIVTYTGARSVELRPGFGGTTADGTTRGPSGKGNTGETLEYDDDMGGSEEFVGSASGAGAGANGSSNKNVKTYNKHLFVWAFCFLLGVYGVDRFLRGQIVLGILKLITGGGIGIWWLVDLIISLLKAYGGAYETTEDFTFVDGYYSR